jgi:hypothetical protein
MARRSMNASKLADWSGIVSSIAVVVTLGFLVIEMGQNTEAIEAATRQAAQDADSRFLIEALNNPETLISWTKPDLTDEEVVGWYFSVLLILRSDEGIWAQYARGTLDEGTWLRYQGALRNTFQYERNRTWWHKQGRRLFEPGFVAEVDALIETTPVANAPLPDVIRTYIEPD